MATAGVDALIICGNQYAGFEGAVFYMSGFEIVHRYVYVVIPLEGEPTLVFPREARWIGDKTKPWVKEQVWPDVPGQWIRQHAEEKNWNRVGVTSPAKVPSLFRFICMVSIFMTVKIHRFCT